MDFTLLEDWNTHWQGAPVSPLAMRHPSPRAAVPLMVQELLDPEDDQWSLRPGPRQIGKTTSLGHVASDLIERGFDPHRIVIAPLDRQVVQRSMGGQLEDLIEAALGLHPATRSAPAVLLLDEVQELPDWDLQLKTAWDRFHDRVRVIATGSSALRLARTTGASLANRIRITRMFPMKFREVVGAHPRLPEFLDEGGWRDLQTRARTVRRAFPGPKEELRIALEDFHGWLAARRGLPDLLRSVLSEYLVWGGYPPVRPGAKLDHVKRLEFFEATWGSIVVRDLAHANVTKIREIQLLFQALSARTGGKFVPANVARDIEVKPDTVAAWKNILEDLFLIQQLPPLKPRLTPDRGKDKAYLLDPGWYAWSQGRLDPTHLAEGPERGALLETVLADHARRLRFNLFHTTAGTVGYVQEPEVDLAIDLGSRWLLLECKAGGSGANALADVGGPNDVRIVVGGQRPDLTHGGVWTIPAHEFALIC